MASDRSFTSYIKTRFYDPIYSAVNDFVEQSWEGFDLRISNVHNVGVMAMSDMEIKFVSVGDLPGLKIEFDVVVDAEIEVTEGDYHYDNYDICSQWLTVRCAGDLACNLDDFQIVDIAEYQKNEMPNPLSDALVPYIYKKDLEKEALKFLERYYPEALKTPMAVEPLKLAGKMGLRVKVREITEDTSIFGQIYFHDSNAEFYNPMRGGLEKTEVEARTIIVDPNVFFLRNLGAVNNTIVHECVHWDKHRKAFELERLYNGSAAKIKCQVVGGIKDDDRSATDWMEWQANSLAPRIQMPLGPFKTKAHEFIKTFQLKLGVTDLIYVMEPVIDALATFFCVSRLAAKIRMIDAGYEEAVGTFTYMDGRYIQPHRFKKGVLEGNQTFSISAIDAAIQSITNPSLVPHVRDGSYLYVDAHFVLNHPKYVTQDLTGTIWLTDYARTHMEECCLVFDLSVRTAIGESYYTECYLNRDETSLVRFEIAYAKGYQHAPPEKQKKILADMILDTQKVLNELPNNLVGSLQMVRKWRNVTYAELAERTLLSERTLRRVMNGEEGGSLNTIILICLGLHLPPPISRHILSKSGFSLKYSDNDHAWYDFMLQSRYAHKMDENREFMRENNITSL